MNGGPKYKFTEAISLHVDCKSQEEVDYYWDKLSEGGEIIQCGWLKDKFGLSGQIVPTALIEMLNDSNTAKASESMMQAMMQMKKLDIAELQKAYAGCQNLVAPNCRRSSLSIVFRTEPVLDRARRRDA